ncbi:MAG: 5-oxoprolinase subunit PxpB [Sediminibacterium sp.]
MDLLSDSTHILRVTAPDGSAVPITVEWQGETAFTLTAPAVIDTAIHSLIRDIFLRLSKASLQYVTDIIPAYHTLTIVFDPAALHRPIPGDMNGNMVLDEVLCHLGADDTTEQKEKRRIRLPVCYHPSLAPDLKALAAELQMDTEELISLHCSPTYRVFMLGFLPGFAYMGPVDARIAAPRLARPRQKVPAGSVGIAGSQTGIYPIDSPGGWQLIGKTPLQLFTPNLLPPCLLHPGDEVIMYPISLDAFHQWPVS